MKQVNEVVRTITIGEAASLLKVSKQTLRNWDKLGKLKAKRHPINNFRIYDLKDIKEIMLEC